MMSNAPASVDAELLLPCRAKVGEGALWDASQRQLYWVDIAGHRVFCYDPEHHANKTFDLGESVGAVVLTRNAKLLLALRSGFAVLDPETGERTRLSDPENHLPGNRFNDGKCDPRGRFWAGTMVEEGQPQSAALYCLDQELQVTRKLDGVTCSNGLVWSKAADTFYYVDTPTQQIQAFDYDAETGAIARHRVIAEIPKSEGAPDGMAIDSEDHLWIALWGGAKVVRLNPLNAEVGFEVRVGALNVTSCTFGGDRLDELYITSASLGMSSEQARQFPNAGGLFRVSVPYRGVPSPRFGRDL